MTKFIIESQSKEESTFIVNLLKRLNIHFLEREDEDLSISSDWNDFAISNLDAAYCSNEPDYSNVLVNEENLEYGNRHE